MANAHAALSAELKTLDVARAQFPMWTDWGVEDESVALHSLGLSYLTTVGQHAGYACCCEYPVAGHKVRADSVWWDKEMRTPAALFEFERHKGGTELVDKVCWWDKEMRTPAALFEFERHKGGTELVDKVRNLLRAYHSLKGKPSLLCLVFWTKNFYPLGDEGVRDLWQIFERGFLAEDRCRVPPAATGLLRVYECLHENAGHGRHTLKQITERRR